MHSNYIKKLGEKRICANCIGETFLHELVERDYDEDQCYYCGGTYPAISLDDMAEHVENAFETYYERTAREPDALDYLRWRDKEIDYEWKREGEPTAYAIMYIADIPKEAANDIQEILADKHDNFDDAAMEGEFSSEACYKKIMPSNEKWHEGWRIFEKTIKFEARFFSRMATAQLSELFDTIDNMRTEQGKPLVIDAGPDTNYTHLYRARVLQSEDKLKQAMERPDKELGAPPSHFASAGRMNASEISVFYGATSVPTALAEVRPPVGSSVVVARFEIIRPLKLLDLSALGEVSETGSIFDPGFADRLGRMRFLRELSHHIIRPVMPDDQASEYLPTQAIADFLATEGMVPLDGILYPSVQVAGDGLNAVLFHKAAKCKELEFPKGTKLIAIIDTTDEDSPEPDYYVTIKVPTEGEAQDEEKHTDPFKLLQIALSDYDERRETLSIDLKSMRVHIVKAVQIDTTEFEVTRRRYTKSDLDF